MRTRSQRTERLNYTRATLDPCGIIKTEYKTRGGAKSCERGNRKVENGIIINAKRVTIRKVISTVNFFFIEWEGELD